MIARMDFSIAVGDEESGEDNDLASAEATQNFIQGSESRSTLPPVRMSPRRFDRLSTLPSVTAPYGIAPEGSTTIFIVSQIARIALTMPASLTVTTSSTYCSINAKFGAPRSVRS